MILFNFLPLIIAVSAIFWVTIFLQTYLHFPKMEKLQRIELSVKNATALAVILACIVALALFWISENFFN